MKKPNVTEMYHKKINKRKKTSKMFSINKKLFFFIALITMFIYFRKFIHKMFYSFIRWITGVIFHLFRDFS